MAVTMPTIDISFKQLANTLIARSERGIAILIVRDETDKTFNTKQYKNLQALALDSAKYTTANYQAMVDVLTFAPAELYVIRVDEDGTIADATALIESTVQTGWVTIAGGDSTDFGALVTWGKAKEENSQTYKVIVYDESDPDCKHIVNFTNSKVVFKDARGEQTGDAYLPSLLGILSSCNVSRGVTYFDCKNLKSVTEVANNASAVAAGQFILINDFDTVKVAEGVNSLSTTNGTTATEDMKYIDIVEVMDLIHDDVEQVFKHEYLGKYKNSYDNQILFLSAVNTYYKELANNDILDPDYNNVADVDVASQRAAWVASGKTEAETWTDEQVKNRPYRRNVYLAGDIKILGAMENLKFTIMMY